MTTIDLHENRLSGSIPPQLPSGLIYLWLAFNVLTGSIPNTLPISLLKAGLDFNQLSGHLPAAWPPNLLWLQVNSNLLTGDVPLFPKCMQVLYLGFSGDVSNNHLTGEVIIDTPTDLVINNNWITAVYITNSSLLQRCDFTNTPLLGFTRIQNISSCTYANLYNASTLPRTVSVLNQNTFWTTPSASTTSTRINVVKVLDPPTFAPLNLLFGLFGAFLGVCILAVAAKYIFKNPNLHSKFGRKNSYGTLNTMASGKQPKKVQTF